MNEENTPQVELIAYCGLYCANCGKYKNGKCPGCLENKKAGWCKIRKCMVENNYRSCADCQKMSLDECGEFNSFMAKAFGFFFNSNRKACVLFIRENGYDEYARYMQDKGWQSIPRK